MRKDGWVFFVHEVEGGSSVRLEGSKYGKRGHRIDSLDGSAAYSSARCCERVCADHDGDVKPNLISLPAKTML